MSTSPDDIAAMRADGDLLDFVRSLAKPAQRKDRPVDEPPDDIEISISRPGAWPDGTRSPGPLPEVARALETAWPGRWKREAA